MNGIIRNLVIGLSLTAMPLLAQGAHHGRGPGMGPGFGHPFAGLNLTEAQKTSLKGLADKHKSAMDAKREAARQAMQDFHKAMFDPATKEADLKALHDKASEAQFAMMLEHRAMMQEGQSLLTPEQKAQWEKLRKERAEKGFAPGMERGKGMKHHPGHGPEGAAQPEKP